MNITELIEKHDASAELKRRLDGAIEAYSLITGWYGAECDCGHPACKRCRHTKQARELIRKASEPMPEKDPKQFAVALLEMVKGHQEGYGTPPGPYWSAVPVRIITDALEELRK